MRVEKRHGSPSKELERADTWFCFWLHILWRNGWQFRGRFNVDGDAARTSPLCWIPERCRR